MSEGQIFLPYFCFEYFKFFNLPLLYMKISFLSFGKWRLYKLTILTYHVKYNYNGLKI